MKKLNNKGLTLIELLVALAIGSMIVITIFSAINSNLKVNTKNDKDIKSLQIAQGEIENLRPQIKSLDSDSINIEEYDEDANEEIIVEVSLEELNEGIDYLKSIDGESDIYDIDLKMIEEDSMYTIDISVSARNEDFSKKSTNIVTKIFGK